MNAFAIHAGWVITMEKDRNVLEDHCVVVEGERILDLVPFDDLNGKYSGIEVIDKSDHILTPGLINAHTHSAMSLFRGMADDLALHTWLSQHIWPMEAKWVSESFVEDGAQLAIAEMLLAGTTCFTDMYFYADIVAKAAQNVGMRAVVGLIVLEFPSIWAENADGYLDQASRVHDEVRALSNVTTVFAPHAPYTVSDDSLRRIQTFADELQIPIQIHLHETTEEIYDSMQEHGKRPIERLNELGILSPRLMAVHMTQLSSEELDLCATSGVHVVHCPRSNLKLSSGICPLIELMKRGTNVCIGTDGAASNNSLNMVEEIRTASLLAKIDGGDAALPSAYDTLEMATINAAKALGLENQLGSISKGKYADLVAFDTQHIAMQPIYHPVNHIVYSAGRDQVSDVWVGGQQLVKNHQLCTIDQTHILQNARDWQQRIQAEAN